MAKTLSGRSDKAVTAAAKNGDFSKNESLVLGVLTQAKGPLSAYTILDQLRQEGLRAPPQIYRALEKLVDAGAVHKLESLNAFIACDHPKCDSNGITAFGICDDCGKVTEFAHAILAESLSAVAATRSFHLHHGLIELRGTCDACMPERQL